MTYQRPAGASQADYQSSLPHEEYVASLFEPCESMVINHNSKELLDLSFSLEGRLFDVDCKQKAQRLSKRWHLLSDVEEQYLFVLTEAEIVKARMFPNPFFFLTDIPNSRSYIASANDLFCVSKHRLLRNNTAKWIVDLRSFHLLKDPADARAYVLDYASSNMDKYRQGHGKEVLQEVQ